MAHIKIRYLQRHLHWNRDWSLNQQEEGEAEKLIYAGMDPAILALGCKQSLLKF